MKYVITQKKCEEQMSADPVSCDKRGVCPVGEIANRNLPAQLLLQSVHFVRCAFNDDIVSIGSRR